MSCSISSVTSCSPCISATGTASGRAASLRAPALKSLVADVLLTLAQKEQATQGWGEWASVIPPAPVSDKRPDASLLKGPGAKGSLEQAGIDQIINDRAPRRGGAKG